MADELPQQATPATGPQGPAPTAAPSPDSELTVRGAANQLIAERRQQEPAPRTPPVQQDGPDPADLAALEQIEPTRPQPQYDEQPEQPRYRLPDGTEATLEDIAEWRRGNLRQSDYTRKTQELAQHRNSLAAQAQQFQQQMQAFHGNQAAYAQAIDNAIAVSSHYLPQAPSEDLRKSDFYSYQEQKAEYDVRMVELQNLYQQRQTLQKVEQAKRQQAHHQHLARQQHSLLSVMPELRDPAKAMAFSQNFIGWAVRNGFTPQEAKAVQDARLVVQLKKAMQYDKLQEAKAKLSEKAKDAQPMQPVHSPARRYSQAERDNQSVGSLRKAFEEKAESGSMASIRDAARLLTAERASAARRR